MSNFIQAVTFHILHSILSIAVVSIYGNSYQNEILLENVKKQINALDTHILSTQNSVGFYMQKNIKKNFFRQNPHQSNMCVWGFVHLYFEYCVHNIIEGASAYAV